MWEVCRLRNKMPSYRITSDVLTHSLEIVGVENADLRETPLPDWGSEPQFSSCSKRETALDELHCALDGRVGLDRQQQMKVVGHDNELMQPELSLRTIVEENADEQSR